MEQDVAYEVEAASNYAENMQSDTNEVDAEDSSEIPNQSENQAIGQSSASAASSNTANHSTHSTYFSNDIFYVPGTNATENDSTHTEVVELQQPHENQQIQTISSGSDAGPSSQTSTVEASPWRQTTTTAMRQHPNTALQHAPLPVRSVFPNILSHLISSNFI